MGFIRQMRFFGLLAIYCSLSLFLCSSSQADQSFWNRYRGPQGSGKSLDSILPVEFDEQRNVQWKSPIHGKGLSSPVVWEQQVWMTTATPDGTKLFAICVDLSSGDLIHDLLVFEVADPPTCHPDNSYASCTPYIEAGRVYVHFGSSGTACIDTQSGEKLWERTDLSCDHLRGPASSPIVHEDLLLIHFDGIDLQYVVALDKQTGETVWKKDRDIDYGADQGDLKKAYGTPAIFNVAGSEQLISPSAVETIAYDPRSGDELWRVRHGGMNASGVPIYEYGLVFINAGVGNQTLIGVRPPSEPASDPKIVWNTGQGVSSQGSVLVHNGALFMFNGSGIATCLAARSGQKLWKKRLGGQFWSSPVLGGKRIYCANREGDVYVLDASPELKILAQNSFPEGFSASPAIAGNRLILRSHKNLYCIGN